MEMQNFINGCIIVENIVASIYKTFMDFFPEEKSFWQDLYRDELEHSLWLSDNTHTEALELLPSKDLLPSIELITRTIDFANGKVSHIKSNPVTLEEALNIALQLEETMVETFTNEVTANLFAHDYKSLSERISAAEKVHINKIEDMMISKGFMQLS
jgi:hypothetical protein